MYWFCETNNYLIDCYCLFIINLIINMLIYILIFGMYSCYHLRSILKNHLGLSAGPMQSKEARWNMRHCHPNSKALFMQDFIFCVSKVLIFLKAK